MKASVRATVRELVEILAGPGEGLSLLPADELLVSAVDGKRARVVRVSDGLSLWVPLRVLAFELQVGGVPIALVPEVSSVTNGTA